MGKILTFKFKRKATFNHFDLSEALFRAATISQDTKKPVFVKSKCSGYFIYMHKKKAVSNYFHYYRVKFLTEGQAEVEAFAPCRGLFVDLERGE